jgi:hypothetical protein
MELKTSEATGGFKWLVGAGAAAIGLSLFLFWADDSVMGKARERDIAHNAELRELRVAQSALPSGVTDERQVLPLQIEAEAQGGTGTK